ncbi:MAG TPA: type II toxin-antitoxin system VapC family toxin [Rhizomicrobium sp.]|nr:type II toxin-antitoxin system VapC family toxin [Rhizomicrobium sp.]
MIGLDTNVVVRLLTRDDAVQARRAADFVAGQAVRGDPVFVSLVVLTETAWVLTSTYGLDPADVTAAFLRLLEAGEFVVEQRQAVSAALGRALRSKVGLADVLIGVSNRSHGCSATATFDRRAAKLDEFFAL